MKGDPDLLEIVDAEARPEGEIELPSQAELRVLPDKDLFDTWQQLVVGPRCRGFERAAGAVAVEIIRRFGAVARFASSFEHSEN